MKLDNNSDTGGVDLGLFRSAQDKVTQKIIDLIKTKINDENPMVSSLSLFDANSVPIVCEDPCIDVNLRKNEAPSTVPKNSLIVEHLVNQIGGLKLKDIALDAGQDFDMKRRAFEELQSCATVLPSDFYHDYYTTIKDQLNFNNSENSAIKKLDQYMASREKIDKYRLLRTLTICLAENVCHIQSSIFNEFHPIAWGRLLLLHTLLSNNSTWDPEKASELAKEITNLDAFIKENTTNRCIEDVLEILIKAQNTCQLDIGFIIKIIKLLRANMMSLEVIFQDPVFLPSIIDELEILRLKAICDRQRIIYTEEKHLLELHNLLLYTEKTVDCILGKVKRNTEITELIDFFKTLKNNDFINKEKFLCHLTPFKNIDIWQNELYFPLIQTFILRKFPLCQRWFPELGTFDIRKATDLPGVELSKYLEFLKELKLTKTEICTNYHECNVTKQEELKMSLNDSANGSLIAQMFHDLNLKLARLMLKCGWSDETLIIIKKWIESLDQELKVAELVEALEILVEYNMDITEKKLSNLISHSTLANVQKEVHKFAINDAFPGTYEKTVDQLIDELIETNTDEGVTLLKNKKLLRDQYDKVMAAYEGFSQQGLMSSEKKIKNWTEKDIKNWAGPYGVIRLLDFLGRTELLARVSGIVPERALLVDLVESVNPHEMIAVIKRTMELISGLRLRDIQLLSVILLVNTEVNKGRLAQINTGEGKTVIIAMIAAYHALRGNRVDIITSSELLAIPQSEDQSKFYETLRISVAHNFNNNNCYVRDVVYGTSAEFQGHILQDEFRKEGIRNDRKCDVAIVDEVDNMLVDGNNYIVMLSKDMPAMDHLEPILAAIFMQVKTAAASLATVNGKIYFKNPQNAVDENGEFKKEIEENYEELSCTAREFIESATERHIRALIRDGDTSTLSKDFPEIKIPNHLRDFICKTHLKEWIESAINAQFFYKQGEDYIIVGDEVKVVDADNTGVVQYNMHWSDGLHQFLQLRHGARLTPESLTSNFISNVSFFKRFRPKLYGLSGTLGCKATKKLLNETYDVDTMIVPPFKLKQHKELAAIVVDNREDWYRAIVRSCLQKLNNGRAVLVIMENISATEKLENMLKNEFSYDEKKIKMYKTDKDSAVMDKSLDSGDIIITTNIAGRGTDVKLSKGMDKNGGLHVCVTFLPKNSRVEHQNIGRTARTGNCGTSQFILLNSENDIRELRNKRAEKEEKAIENSRTEIARVTTSDMIFQKFCQLLDDINGRNEFSRSIEKDAVEERFAIWMKMNSDKISEEPRVDVLKDFELFREEIKNDDKDNNLIRNPYMYVKIGNKYLEDKNYTNAIEEYGLAIKLDKNFAEHARYNRGFCYVAKYGDDLSGNENYINKAVRDFEKARSLIEQREKSLYLEQHASDGEVFLLKIKNKFNLYNLQKNAIDIAIGPDCVAIDKQLEKLEKDKKSDDLTSEQKKDIKKAIKDLKKLKEVDGVIQSARSKGRDLRIELRELKKCLPDDDKSHDKEIEEFEENGAIGSFEISEIPPIDWSAVIGLLALGFAQLLLGAALMVFTLGGGACFGMALITEGISDIITAVKDGIINRSFSWATWAIEKAISLTIAVVCAGFSAMKDVAKTAYRGAKTAVTTLKTGVTQATKDGWKIVAKKLGFELAKGVGKNIAMELVNYGLNKTLIPAIQSAIIDRIREPIEEALLDNPDVKIMLELDKKNNNRYYEDRIKAVGLALLRPEKNTDLLYIIARIGSGIADKKVAGYTDTREICTAIYGLYELATFTNKYIDELNVAIHQEAIKNDIYKKRSEKSVPKDKQKDRERQSPPPNTSQSSDDDVDLNRIHDNHDQVKSKKKIKRDPSNISKVLAGAAAESMVNIIKGKMLNPLIQRGVNYTASKFTNDRDEALSATMKTFRSYKRVIHYQNKISSRADNQHPDNHERSAEERFAIDKARKMIQDVREGGPSGIMHLGSVSKVIGRPIALRDKNGTLLCVIGDVNNGLPVEVEYHKPESEGTIGHYTLPGGVEPPNRYPNENLCLYNVIGHQSGHEAEELKNLTLTTMENHIDQLAMAVDDVTHLWMYEEMKLAMGGSEYIDQFSDDAKNYTANVNRNDAFGFNSKGYNHLSASYKKFEYPLRSSLDVANKRTSIYENDLLKRPRISKEDSGVPHEFLFPLINKLKATEPLGSKPCPENAINESDKITEFTSQSELNFVIHSARQTKEVKNAIAKLNQSSAGSGDLADSRQVITLSKAQLGLSQDVFATGKLMRNGKLVQCVWPVEDITVVVEYRNNEQGVSETLVYVHAMHPLPPG